MRETTDLNVKYVAYFGIALLLVVVVASAGVAWVFKSFLAREQAQEVSRSQLPAVGTELREPRLEINPERENQVYLAEQREVLNRYGWVDPDRTAARIPIERAMDIIAEEGVK